MLEHYPGGTPYFSRITRNSVLQATQQEGSDPNKLNGFGMFWYTTNTATLGLAPIQVQGTLQKGTPLLIKM